MDGRDEGVLFRGRWFGKASALLASVTVVAAPIALHAAATGGVPGRRVVGTIIVTAVLVAFFVFSVRVALMVGVRLSPSGVLVRSPLGRSRHLSWDQVDRFVYEDRFPFVVRLVTTDGNRLGLRQLAALTRAVGPRLHARSVLTIEALVSTMNGMVADYKARPPTQLTST